MSDESGERDGDSRLVADLHLHTTASDGVLTVSELPGAAREAGLDWISVTDHDRIHPELDAPVVSMGDETDTPLRVVRGIELRVEAGDQRLDLLGYGVRDTDALRSETERLQRDRIERARSMIDCIEDRIGTDLDLDVEHGVGRPHVARAIAESDSPYDYEDAFAEFIGDDGPCFVARDVPSFERGARLLRESCSLVGLAHPFRYGDLESALDRAAELDAIERDYPYGRDVDLTRIDELAAEHDLLCTGGSDAHDRTLGTAGLDADGFAPIRERLPTLE